MGIQEDIYKEFILEYALDESFRGHLENPTIKEEGYNRSCGDEISIELEIKDNHIHKIRINPQGCSISAASAAMLAEIVSKKDLQYSQEVTKQFKKFIMEGVDDKFIKENEILQSFHSLYKYPIRVKCATLSWNTLEQAIKVHLNKKNNL